MVEQHGRRPTKHRVVIAQVASQLFCWFTVTRNAAAYEKNLLIKCSGRCSFNPLLTWAHLINCFLWCWLAKVCLRQLWCWIELDSRELGPEIKDYINPLVSRNKPAAVWLAWKHEQMIKWNWITISEWEKLCCSLDIAAVNDELNTEVACWQSFQADVCEASKPKLYRGNPNFITCSRLGPLGEILPRRTKTETESPKLLGPSSKFL